MVVGNLCVGWRGVYQGWRMDGVGNMGWVEHGVVDWNMDGWGGFLNPLGCMNHAHDTCAPK